MKSEDQPLLTPLEAAHHLGITTELLFQFTKRSFGKTTGLRSLQTVEKDGQTRFSLPELDAFDSLLGGEWCDSSEHRPSIPKGILDHLRAESQNQCARCGSGAAVDTAHIRPGQSADRITLIISFASALRAIASMMYNTAFRRKHCGR